MQKILFQKLKMKTKIINTNTAEKIKENRLEDKLVLNDIENIFRKRRPYVIRMPKEGNTVVAAVSGGLDTITNLAILMKEFKLNVYPVFVNRGQTNYRWEKQSVEFFNEYYKKMFPKHYHDFFEIKLESPPAAYKNILRDTKNLKDNSFLRKSVAYPARNSTICISQGHLRHSSFLHEIL